MPPSVSLRRSSPPASPSSPSRPARSLKSTLSIGRSVGSALAEVVNRRSSPTRRTSKARDSASNAGGAIKSNISNPLPGHPVFQPRSIRIKESSGGANPKARLPTASTPPVLKRDLSSPSPTSAPSQASDTPPSLAARRARAHSPSPLISDNTLDHSPISSGHSYSKLVATSSFTRPRTAPGTSPTPTPPVTKKKPRPSSIFVVSSLPQPKYRPRHSQLPVTSARTNSSPKKRIPSVDEPGRQSSTKENTPFSSDGMLSHKSTLYSIVVMIAIRILPLLNNSYSLSPY